MRSLAIIAVLGTTLFAAAPSQAATMRFAPPAAAPAASIIKARLVCNPSRCIDPRTGAYTESGCDYRGCYPLGGVIGRTYPSEGGYGYRDRDWRDYR